MNERTQKTRNTSFAPGVFLNCLLEEAGSCRETERLLRVSATFEALKVSRVEDLMFIKTRENLGYCITFKFGVFRARFSSC